MVHLNVCSYHVTYAFQSESTLYSCLNVKELLARSRRENIQAERYLAKLGIIASASARNSNCSSKGKSIRDDLMLDCKGKEKNQFNS